MLTQKEFFAELQSKNKKLEGTVKVLTLERNQARAENKVLKETNTKLKEFIGKLKEKYNGLVERYNALIQKHKPKEKPSPLQQAKEMSDRMKRNEPTIKSTLHEYNEPKPDRGRGGMER